jgi:hypothetical protein
MVMMMSAFCATLLAIGADLGTSCRHAFWHFASGKDRQLMTACKQMSGHGRTHDTQSDKTDFAH